MNIDKKVKKLEDENEFLRNQIHEVAKKRTIDLTFTGSRILIGVISDTHKGSIYENPQLEEELIKYFNSQKVEAICHAGDLIDGEDMYRGHEYELQYHGADAQVWHFTKEFPLVKSKMYFITGNHDQSFWTGGGHDIGVKISKERKDMKFLGRDQATIRLKPKVSLMMVHPSGGTAYAVSYKSQKIVESLSGGEKPSILLIGHYHKYDHIFYRNIQTFQVPTTQSQTPYMKRKPTPAIMGGILLDIRTDRNGISNLKVEYLPFYEGR